MVGDSGAMDKKNDIKKLPTENGEESSFIVCTLQSSNHILSDLLDCHDTLEMITR